MLTREFAHTTPLRPDFLFWVRVYEPVGKPRVVVCSSYCTEKEYDDGAQVFPYLETVAGECRLENAVWIEHLPGQDTRFGRISEEFAVREADIVSRAAVEDMAGEAV